MANEGKMIELEVGGAKVGAYLAEPEGEAEGAGVIIVHEWWGLNDHIKDIARRFAGEGYVALAPDLYDGKVTKDADEAGRLMQAVDNQQALAKLDAAVEYLRNHEKVEGGRVGVTGFCIGGSFALQLPIHNQAVKAAAPFYGDVPPDEELEKLQAPILFIGAENDFWITRDKMNRLKDALNRFGKAGEVHVYPGVGHAFFNDTRPDAYDQNAAADAWERVKAFFQANL